MPEAIYISRNGQREGPLSLEQVRERLDDGRLAHTDLAWYKGRKEWTTVGQVPGLAPELEEQTRLDDDPPREEDFEPIRLDDSTQDSEKTSPVERNPDETVLEESVAGEKTTIEKKTFQEEQDPEETVREEGASKRSGGFGLVGKIFQGQETSYQVLEALPATGSEADIYVVQSEGAGEK
ncbi:uncharacterized protein METZ01_LOCUS491622, partial [marine metagenome]